MPVPRRSPLKGTLVLTLLGLAGCETAQPPPHAEVVELRGGAYERGVQHGRHYASKIQSFYTQMLTTSLIPYLNRERPDIAEVLLEYQDERYDDGQFAYLVLLESGRNLERFIPEEYREEMRGIADGAGVPYDTVLLLNTFMDTLVAFRAITFFIRAQQAPKVTAVEFIGDLASDGVDNDGDRVVDEPDEGRFEPFDPSRWASLVELPTDGVLRFRLEDADGVSPELIRVQLDLDVYQAGGPEVTSLPYGEDGTGLEVTFQPPGLEPARAYAIMLSAGDETWVEDPPPAHARQMRDLRITFTTAGYGAAPEAVENRGYDDGRYQPPAMGFAVRGGATPDGAVRLGHHFALLDSNSAHKHAALFAVRPETGHPHVYAGWAGIVFGFAGMNSEGLGYGVNMSDTLNNPLAKEFKELLVFAQIRVSGLPVGIMGRELLRQHATVGAALAWLQEQKPTYGWNWLLADRARRLAAVEMHADILEDASNPGFVTYAPETTEATGLDPWGRPLASVGADDLRITSHYQAIVEDLWLTLFGYALEPQRFWSSFFFRSVRSHHLLGQAIRDRLGALDAEGVAEVLGLPELVDERDSMSAVVLEPERGLFHWAMGQMPATAGQLRTFDLAAWNAVELGP